MKLSMCSVQKEQVHRRAEEDLVLTEINHPHFTTLFQHTDRQGGIGVDDSDYCTNKVAGGQGVLSSCQ